VPRVKLLDPADDRRRLGRYELIGEIATGGMASVHLARLAGVGGFQRFVAIKQLHPHLANEEEFIEMFLDEARLAAGIHHPNVVPILEVGQNESGSYYLVMEYIEGDTLGRIFARAASSQREVPYGISLRIVLDALAGLHAAHELTDGTGASLHLVHRDVSPQNILVGVDGSSRLTDFGVARASSRIANTRSDTLKGKLAYMSPEQAKAMPLDRRSDIFAMGVLFWEAMAGRRLLKADSEAATLARILVEPMPSLLEVVPGIHPAFDFVAQQALDRDPSRRFQTAADMAVAIEDAAREASQASPTDIGVSSPREVAAFVQSLMGQEILAQRESVRSWLTQSEPSSVYGRQSHTDLRRATPVPASRSRPSSPRDARDEGERDEQSVTRKRDAALEGARLARGAAEHATQSESERPSAREEGAEPERASGRPPQIVPPPVPIPRRLELEPRRRGADAEPSSLAIPVRSRTPLVLALLLLLAGAIAVIVWQRRTGEPASAEPRAAAPTTPTAPTPSPPPLVPDGPSASASVATATSAATAAPTSAPAASSASSAEPATTVATAPTTKAPEKGPGPKPKPTTTAPTATAAPTAPPVKPDDDMSNPYR
jgi:serine/threonine protein kinase